MSLVGLCTGGTETVETLSVAATENVAGGGWGGVELFFRSWHNSTWVADSLRFLLGVWIIWKIGLVDVLVWLIVCVGDWRGRVINFGAEGASTEVVGRNIAVPEVEGTAFVTVVLKKWFGGAVVRKNWRLNNCSVSLSVLFRFKAWWSKLVAVAPFSEVSESLVLTSGVFNDKDEHVGDDMESLEDV